jgi:hypothetical protein
MGNYFLPDSICGSNPDLSHLAGLSIAKRLVPLWNGANPLHCEILQCVEKLAEIVTRDFEIMSGKCDSYDFAVLCTHKRCSDQLAVRKEMLSPSEVWTRRQAE